MFLKRSVKNIYLLLICFLLLNIIVLWFRVHSFKRIPFGFKCIQLFRKPIIYYVNAILNYLNNRSFIITLESLGNEIPTYQLSSDGYNIWLSSKRSVSIIHSPTIKIQVLQYTYIIILYSYVFTLYAYIFRYFILSSDLLFCFIILQYYFIYIYIYLPKNCFVVVTCWIIVIYTLNITLNRVNYP